MKNRVIQKIHSNSGESIAETLVSVLIAAFALLMLAGTVNTASNLITKSRKSLTEYYGENNEIEDRQNSSDSTATFSLAAAGDSLSWSNPYSVKLYTNDYFDSDSKRVIAYKLAP